MLIILISACALGGVYVGFILILFSGFIVDDIDYTQMQRQVFGTKGVWISLFGVVSLCGSILILLISSRIAGLMFKILGLRLSK
jgi:phosphoglycerol transferase MdoB-like AlkP superfamily enzyme